MNRLATRDHRAIASATGGIERTAGI